MKRFIGDAKKRRIYSELLNNKRWLLLRKAKLNETGGLCERCLSEGRFVSASVVHHVVPVEWGVGRFGMEKLAYNKDNLMCLCAYHHKQIHMELSSFSAEKSRKRHEAELEEFRRKFGLAGEPERDGNDGNNGNDGSDGLTEHKDTKTQSDKHSHTVINIDTK